MSSFADQFLKAGLVDAKKLQKINKDKKKQQKTQQKQKKNNSTIVDQSKLVAQEALHKKADISRKLNQQKETEFQAKAIKAQIKQLIVTNTINREGDIAFNFVDQGKIRKIYINETLQNNLIKRKLAIIKLLNSYELVPAVIAEKIAQRDSSCVLWMNDSTENIDDNDPYADYKIPDDLMW